MAFQFKLHTQTDISRAAYELPPLPAGVGYELKQHIDAYRDAVINGPDGHDEEAFLAIKAHPARGIPEVIAKVIYQLHFDHRGLSDDDDLVITEGNDEDKAAIQMAEAVLGELYACIPSDWEAARRALHTAILDEDDFDRRIYGPAKQGNGGHLVGPCAITHEQERLLDVRCDAETVLLNIPAPTLADWAVKFLICFDCDRDMNAFTDALCTEARQFLGITVEPQEDHSNDLRVMAATVASRSPVAASQLFTGKA